MSENIYFFEGKDPEMKEAYLAAQRTFKYFWRELSWERRRIIPGLDMSMVKLPFTDGERIDGQPEYEHMWVGEVDFDGETISGTLMNSPHWLTSVEEGEAVEAPFSDLEDWMMTSDGQAYGGFTVNLMRLKMSAGERQKHDDAWGLKFGDPTKVRLEIWKESKPKRGLLGRLFGGAKEEAEGHQEHPMGVNMLPSLEEQLKADASDWTSADEEGWTMLGREALAGNFGVVKLLVKYGADVRRKMPNGKTAAELARGIGWREIAEYLEG
jgi:uncharacterized protein YegJ (DUF2314 family)